ncbi:MAG TPA: hypothetical protein PLR96_14400 [Flavobacteriales bacterium]|nr:hypothetical protein [Flavobacteriales bacterium]
MHSVPMDRDRVRNLALSCSCVKHGVADIPAFLQALETLLDSDKPPRAGGNALCQAGHRLAGHG